ncbi:hypothetical protein MPAN_011270 [Mariniplasma anaerobium]|uniref:Uncharacterized protein n=1 Tax=Mariniplasma anaerobium TaxID=2735436 RepID=A0A7U9TK27_9MOLU|nr:hypothetical protein MPAN_011270 [Mariniplasma anaerobium]
MVEIVDSVFSKNIIAPIYIIAIMVASTNIMNGNIDESISISSMKYKSRNHIRATTKLIVVTLYLLSRCNSPFIKTKSL